MQHPPVCPDVLPQKAMTGQFCEAAPVQCTVHSEDATPKPKKAIAVHPDGLVGANTQILAWCLQSVGGLHPKEPVIILW
jgi:hypothetical protein